jgi:hypothetical protein
MSIAGIQQQQLERLFSHHGWANDITNFAYDVESNNCEYECPRRAHVILVCFLLGQPALRRCLWYWRKLL